MIESGVMVMKNGLAWGLIFADGHSSQFGWTDPCKAPIHNPQFCTKPTDVTWTPRPDMPYNSYYDELSTGKIVYVERETTVRIKGDWP